MKKVMMAVGVAACVTLVGCKHGEYGPHKVGNKVKPVETVEVASDVDPLSVPSGADQAATPAVSSTPVATVAADPSVPDTMAVPTDDDGKSTTTVTDIPDEPVKTVEPKADGGKTPAAGKDAPAKADGGKAAAGAGAAAAGAGTPAAGADAAEAEFTPYVVRGGDTLGGICLRYKVKKADVLKLNPGMNPDKIFVGRTIKLPGNIEAAKAAPAAATKAAGGVAKDGAKAAEPTGKREYKPYTGETKEYIVKSGDTIGHIAYSNGLSIRQFKELNGLKGDVIRVDQKVKIPVEKVKSDKPVAVAAKKSAEKQGPKVDESKIAQIKPVAEVKPAETIVSSPADAPVEPEAKLPEAAAPEAVEPAEPAAAGGNYTTYVVKPNDDLYSVAIKWSVTASQLKEINNLDDETLKPGQVLKVPAVAD